MKSFQQITFNLGWLYPDLMSTYGDRGNIIVLKKRCLWRGITFSVIPVTQTTSIAELEKVDMFFGGGAQDIQQEIVMHDLRGQKANGIKKLIESDKPALFVCGSPQLMGQYYEPAEGKRIEGVGLFDMVTKHPGTTRCIGNIYARVQWDNLSIESHPDIVGFENHGGRTFLGTHAKPFATVVKGFGNNGKDKTEGVVYKNAVGTYLHGPFLPKNPHVADFFIKRTLEIKYQKMITLQPLDNTLAEKARNSVLKKLR